MAKTEVFTVRMGHAAAELIRQEAEMEDVSAAQFFRDAALARAVWLMARREAQPGRDWQTITSLIEAAHEDPEVVALAMEAAERGERPDLPHGIR